MSYNLGSWCKKLLEPDLYVGETVFDQSRGDATGVFQCHRFNLHDCLFVGDLQDRSLLDPRYTDRGLLPRRSQDFEVRIVGRVVGSPCRQERIHVDVHRSGLDKRVGRIEVQNGFEFHVGEVITQDAVRPDLERVVLPNFEIVAH